jgi:predicted amidophosphoribosyltransferase
MRNPAPAQPGVCSICRTFISPAFQTCRPCHENPNNLDAALAITYSVRGGQMHTALRGYKDRPAPVQRYAMPRLAGILWRFLREHGACVASASGVGVFDIVTAVPSSTPERDDERPNLRTMIEWCDLVSSRFRRVIRATGTGLPGHTYDEGRYEGTELLSGQSVLLIDDTWTTGAHAQSAAYALRQAGASRVGMVAIGRHVKPDYEPIPGETCQERWAALPTPFDWGTCACHASDQ